MGASVVEELQAQMLEKMDASKFPVHDTDELLDTCPNGAATTCEAGDIKLVAGDICEHFLADDDFPIDEPRGVVDIVLKRADFE